TDLKVAEEHDPGPIQSDADAISPFSTARVALLNSGYFGTAAQNLVALQPQGFSVTRPVFMLVRQNSVTDHTGADGIPFPWNRNPNWVETLFGPAGTPTGNPGGFMARASLARNLVQSAGFCYSYSDQGLCHS